MAVDLSPALDRASQASSSSSLHQSEADDDFVDAEASVVHEDDQLKPPTSDISPRSSNASESGISSVETGLTQPSVEDGLIEPLKRASLISDGSTVDSVPLDEVPLEERDEVAPLPSHLRSPKVGTPTQDGPIASSSRSPSLHSGAFEGKRPSWRHSTPLSPVSLSTSSAGDENESASVNGTVGNSAVDKRRTMTSVTSGTSDTTGNFDFLLQRIATQNALLHDDPKARRRSVQASDSLRKSFERLHNELAAEEGLIDWDFWGAVMNDYEKVAREQPRELARAIQRGIPPALRGMMWQLMSSARDPDLEAIYQQMLKTPSSHEKAIMRDLARTFPSHEYFRDTEGVGQGNLFNVVKAYSLFDAEVGYCQGLQFIVGPMLLNMPDEEAFCVLVRLMKSYDLRSHFQPEMPGLQLRLFQFDRLLEEQLPALFLHLLRQGVKSSMYASQWFLTMLSYRFPLELVYSVLDLVFAEGVEAILRFSLALMKKNETMLLGLEFEQLLEFLKNSLFEVYRMDTPEGEPARYSAADFVKDALKIQLMPATLDQLAHEWSSMCQQRDATTIELERLRTVNAQLSTQVRRLEASLAQINEEHCELVKQLVHTRLEREEVEEELVKWKVAVASAGVEISIS